jgi:hypothetical protein
LEKIDKIIIAITVVLMSIIVILSSNSVDRKDFEQLEICSIACKSSLQILKISSRNENGDITCYCETSPGVIDEVRVEDERK